MSTEQAESIALTVQATPGIVLLDKKKFAEFLEYVKQEIATIVPDVSTEKGREAISKMAFKLSRTKTAIDNAGKELKEESLRKSQAIDAARREVREKLEALRDEVRKPLTEWEVEEERRRAECQKTIDLFKDTRIVTPNDTSDTLRRVLISAASVQLAESVYRDLYTEARDEQSKTEAYLNEQIARLAQQEADAAELARLRAERDAAELARLQREASEREAIRIAEKEAAAKVAEEQRQVREAAAIAKAAKDAEEKARLAAEASAREAAAKIEREHAAEVERLLREKYAAEAKEREARELSAKLELARKSEEDRVEREAARKKAEEERIAADEDHRERVIHGAEMALIEHSGIMPSEAIHVIDLIVNGKIPNVSIRFS